MNEDEVTGWVEEATLDFTLGELAAALQKLDRALAADPNHFEAWHARSEILFAEKRYDEAREAAERAYAIRPGDLHLNTSLSRIWMELGDKERAEHFGAQARMLSWREQLREPPPEG